MPRVETREAADVLKHHNLATTGIFIDLLPQWQLEELDCIRLFFRIYYGIAFGDDTEIEANSTGQVGMQQPRDEEGMSSMKSSIYQLVIATNQLQALNDLILARYLQRKLRPLHRTSRSNALVHIESLGHHLKTTLKSDMRIPRFFLNFADHQNGHVFCEDNLKEPNVAWAWVRDKNHDPRHTCLTQLRLFGYIFWDEKTLKEWKVTMDNFRV